MTMNQPESAGESLDVTVGRRVFHLMWDRKITQTALGKQIGMDQSSLAKRLRGERGWSLDQVQVTARALSTTVAYLVGEVDDPMCTPRDLNPEPTDSRSEPCEVVSIDSARSLRAPVIPLDAA